MNTHDGILAGERRADVRPQRLAAEPQCVLIPAGEFSMGCDAGRDDEKPVHRVSVDAFEMAVFQVRNRDWAELLAATGHPEPPNWRDPAFNHPDQPVVAVSWIEAVKYCAWLTEASGRRYRLPTEAEWERAALGGRNGALYPWGDEPPQEHSAYLRRWGGEVTAPLPVGLDEPNPYGLYDIGENVHEWCADWYARDYYSQFSAATAGPMRNPQGSATGERRSSRGGSWRHQIKVSRVAARSSIPPVYEYADYGFRVVREL